MKKEIIILTTWGWKDIYHIDWNIKDYMNMKTQAKQNWEDWFWSEKYQTFIKFASLEKEQGKTQYIALPEPKQEKKELTPKERQARDKMLKEILDKTYNNRKKKFIERRAILLRDLAKEEQGFWLETTLNKLQQYKKAKIKNLIK